MVYSKVVIYYFSGTGNAKKAAEWIADEAFNFGVNATVYSIDNPEKIVYPDGNEKTLIGFCSATHGFNLPPIMLRFIYKFPKIKNCNTFILNTRAGMKLFKIFTPGLSGIALILPFIFLLFKGYKTIGFRPLDMPSNWISLHPGIRKKIVISIFERCEKISRDFTKKILSGKKVYRGLFSLPLDLLITPISLGYYLVGRFMLSKTFISTSDCNNCGLCLKQCPVKAIENQNNQMYWTFKCESCMKCMNNCPQRAIEVPISYVAIIWYLALGLVPNFIMDKILLIIKVPLENIYIQLIYNILLFIFIFLFSYLGYKMLHLLMRYRVINKIIAYTSLTKYKFWRRYNPKKM